MGKCYKIREKLKKKAAYNKRRKERVKEAMKSGKKK